MRSKNGTPIPVWGRIWIKHSNPLTNGKDPEAKDGISIHWNSIPYSAENIINVSFCAYPFKDSSRACDIGEDRGGGEAYVPHITFSRGVQGYKIIGFLACFMHLKFVSSTERRLLTCCPSFLQGVGNHFNFVPQTRACVSLHPQEPFWAN